MKKQLLLIMLTIPFWCSSQQITAPLYVEVFDTVEVAYSSYRCGYYWTDGDVQHIKWCNDSIGLDSIRITKFYYLRYFIKTDSVLVTFENRDIRDIYVRFDDELVEKVYLDYTEKKYLTKPKGKTTNFYGL